MTHLLSDVDGVVLDSYLEHRAVTAGILSLLGDDRPLGDRDDERERFGAETFDLYYGPAIADGLISARPALMAARVHRSPLHTAVLDALVAAPYEVVLITSGYGSAVRRRLGDRAAAFDGVLGCEDGPKEHLLHLYAGTSIAYVTDTARNVRRCIALGIRTIGVTWRFDDAVALQTAGCDLIITEPTHLDDATRRLTP